MTDWDILHCFADEGIESEALAAYGSVTRVGLDPKDNPHTDEVIACDARELPFQDDVAFDLGLFHPPCQKFSVQSHIHDVADDYENLIPEAKKTAEKYCENYIIENVPQAPLNNPVILNGTMFGSPLHYERAFETNYHVDQPRQQAKLTEHKKFETFHETGGWCGRKELWKSAKGYTGDYDFRPLAREAIPRAYINYLIRPLL